MRLPIHAACLLIALAAAPAPGHAAQTSDPMQHPRVAGAGGVRPVAGDVLMPSREATHRILIDATEDSTTAQGTNRHLDTAARALNLYALAGVPDDRVHVEVVVHGKATSMVLSDAAYRAAHGKPNPDAALIEALHAAGATVSVCGQALLQHGHTPAQVHPRVKVALSAITRVTELQEAGFRLLPW